MPAPRASRPVIARKALGEAAVAGEPGGRRGRQHPAAVQHHDRVGGVDLVEQVRRPEHADAGTRRQLAHDAHDLAARLHVEPDRRLVEQQQPRAVQQRAGDLGAALLAAGQPRDPAVQQLGEPDLRRHLGRPRAARRLAGRPCSAA